MEERVNYLHTNTYSSLNVPGVETTHVWWVFHGLGYLSRYFLKYFKFLPPNQHFIIAPQAPSKYYLNDTYTHVGASWLTKEETETGIENNLNYLDAVYKSAMPAGEFKLMVLGFSQGVSMATRWLAHRKIPADHLILFAGGIPNELGPEQLNHLIPETKVSIVYGDKDPFLTEDRLTAEAIKIERVFQGKARILRFEGGHEINSEVLLDLLAG